MEDTARTKIALMKPVLHKVGIPIAISVAGFILARFTFGRKNSGLKHLENEFDNPPDLCNDQQSCHNDFHIIKGDQYITNIHDMYSLDTSHAMNIHELEEQIVCLKGKVQDLEGRELELKFRFLHHLEMKDQEMELTELENRLSLEILKSEFLDRELLSMEAETKRFEGMLIDFLKLARQLQISILENKVLYKIIRRLLSKAKEMSDIMQRKNKEVEAGQAEMSRNNEELSRRADRISVLENELLEMRHITEKQEEENNELVNKLNLAENSASLKNSIFKEDGLEGESESSVILDDHGISIIECTTPSSDHSHAHAHSKRAKLIEKFKRWVEGSEKTKRKSGQKNHGEVVKCVGKRMGVSYDAEEIQVSARNSCSSACHNSPNGKD